MTKFLQRRDLQWLLALALSLILAFATRWRYVGEGFYKAEPDDFVWIKVKLSGAMLWKVITPEGMVWFYRPVFLIWMMLFHQIAPFSSVALHVGSLTLFGLAVFGVGAFVARITGARGAGVLAAMLFLTAPSMEEAIWWISSASTLLATVFSLAALHALLSWRATQKRAFFVLMLAAMGLALGSKEDAATLPLILIAVDVFLAHREGAFARGWRAAARRLGPTSAAILIGMAIYAALDLTAYHHAVIAGAPSNHLWRGVTRSVLDKTSSFGAHTLFFDQFGPTFSVIPAPILQFGFLVAIVLAAFRRSPWVLCALAAGLLGFLPVPIATGAHVFSGRFWYLPNLYGVILCSAIVVQTLRSARPMVRLAGAVLMADVIVGHLPVTVDLFVAWMLEFAVVIASYACWRYKPAMGRIAVLASAQAILLFCAPTAGFDNLLLPLSLAFGAIYGASLGFRMIPIGVALGAALALNPPWSIAALLAGGLWICSTTPDRPKENAVISQPV